MVDSRYYLSCQPITLNKLAVSAAASLVQGDAKQEIHSIGPIESLQKGCIGFVREARNLPSTLPDNGVLVVNQQVAELLTDWSGSVLVHNFPILAFTTIADLLVKPKLGFLSGNEASDNTKVHSTAHISPGVALGTGVTIGAGSYIGANSTIAVGVSIGSNCHISSGVHISFADIADNVHISSGVVIGGSGFGTTPGPDGLVDIPHFGTVQIANNVSIGSNTTIDRGVFTATSIGQFTKIDNLVQIAHNVVIGESCVLAAQTGISGSVQIGDRVLMGGKVGIKDHITIGSDCVIYAGSSLMTSMQAGEKWGGAPAQPFRHYLREIAAIRKIASNKRNKNN